MTELPGDVLHAVRLLTIIGLRSREDEAGIARFRREACTILLLPTGSEYVVRWPDGTPLCRVPADDVAWVVAILRELRGDPVPALVN